MNKRGSILTSSTIIEVPFHDCDPMQVVWHGNYPRYLEVARCELLRLFDYDYIQMTESGYMWPIVDMRIKYIGSAQFTQHIKVDAFLKEYETQLKIDYLISCVETGKKLSKAYTVQVAVEIKSKEMQFSSPEIIKTKLKRVIS